MATANPLLIDALRRTADKLQNGAKYEWGHMGRCNCGHLVQTITNLSDDQLVESVDHQLDEWSEHAKDYCSGTGTKVDDLFRKMNDYGFNYKDMQHLEYLNDPEVLADLPAGRRHLQKNDVNDVCLYMNKMADIMEESLQPA